MGIVYYSQKGSGLTSAEIDGNFNELDTGKLDKNNGSISVRAAGDVDLGQPLANDATTGFPFIPTIAVAPTEAPTNITSGYVPICFCTADSKLYIYVGSAWIASAAFA